MNNSKLLKINPSGFREYDARWLYEKDINLLGIENLGKGFGTQVIQNTILVFWHKGFQAIFSSRQ